MKPLLTLEATVHYQRESKRRSAGGALLFVLALILVLSPAAFADDTEKLLEATPVHDVLRLGIAAGDPKKPVVTYMVDEHRSGVLHDGDTFSAPGAVFLTFGDFNPFRYSVGSTQKTRKDPVQEAIDSFAADLAGTAKGIVPEQPAGGAQGLKARTAVEADCIDAALPVRAEVERKVLAKESDEIRKKTLTDEDRKKELAAARDTAKERAKEIFNEKLDVCGACKELESGLIKLRDALGALKEPDVNKEVLRDWVAQAQGHAGLSKTIVDVMDTLDRAKGKQQAAEEAKKEATTLLESLRTLSEAEKALADDMVKAGVSPAMARFPSCVTAARGSELGAAITAIQAASERRERLIESLNKLLAVLKAYESMAWRNDRDVIFDTVETDPAQIVTPTVTIKTLTYAYDEDRNTIEPTVVAEATRSFDVRRARRLVSEYGLAGIYNDLQYPKYSIDDDGKVKKDFDKSNVNMGVTLNFLCGSCIGSGVYPGFQVGLSKAKDYPGILAGGVLRFGGTNRISVASGAMITWFKDLHALHVGDAASEDKLKADLKLRRSPAAWYLAVQYTFR